MFTAIAYLLAVSFQDRAAEAGGGDPRLALPAVVYDGLLLVGTATLSNYPVEHPVLVAVVLNPIDLARVILLLRH